MEELVTQMIWCEYCCREGWGQVSSWVWAGRAVTRSGTLKVPVECKSCGDELPVGSRVEAIALNWEDPDTDWMRDFVVTDEELEEGIIEAIDEEEV